MLKFNFIMIKFCNKEVRVRVKSNYLSSLSIWTRTHNIIGPDNTMSYKKFPPCNK